MEAIISAEELLCQHSKNYGTIKLKINLSKILQK